MYRFFVDIHSYIYFSFHFSSFCWFSCFVGVQNLHLTHGFQAQKGRHFVLCNYTKLFIFKIHLRRSEFFNKTVIASKPHLFT
ncbi:hypothetical protein BWD14_14840 [Leptospira santarosai]|uniref:Lipoprotein n=1 Tax=Leptospira santarosai TaxID=28183 RepID=A0AB73ME13_9LEPT|nr:hypothetical protein BWD14_14840 [Leptospira santarosai]